MLEDQKVKKIKTIKKQRFSFKYLNELCNTYKIDEYTIWNYCCYGEDKNCWIDVESSWMRDKYISDKDLNKRIYSSIKRSILDDFKDYKNIGKINIFIGESDDAIFLCIPMRDKRKYDFWICFNKNVKV